MARSKLGLPVLVRSIVAPFQNILQLLICPSIQVDRLDSADMCSHASVDARTAYADEHTEIPAGPPRMLVSLTICTDLVAF
jgi:hypothetical protein